MNTQFINVSIFYYNEQKKKKIGIGYFSDF